MHGLIVHLSTWSTSNQTIIPHLRLISLYVFRATTGCLIGTQMCCHFLSLCGHNRATQQVLFYLFICLLNYYVSKTEVHSTQVKRWKVERQWWGACQIPKKNLRDGGGEGRGVEKWLWSTAGRVGCFYALLPWNAIKITRITILRQCYFHFTFARLGFLWSMKWRSHQLLKPPLIILPRVFAAAVDVQITHCVSHTHTCVYLDIAMIWNKRLAKCERPSTVMLITSFMFISGCWSNYRIKQQKQ